VNDENMTVVSCDQWWRDGWRGAGEFVEIDGVLIAVGDAQVGDTRVGDARVGDAHEFDRPRRIHVPGALLAGLVDHHVHLGLVDARELFRNGVSQAHDMGWIGEVAELWNEQSAQDPSMPDVLVAGGFITCVGGYPSTSSWAPRAAAVEVATRAQAVEAVEAQAKRGAAYIKVMLNSDAGPVLDDELLTCLVDEAHLRDLPVFAHVQGSGQAERAFDAGADALAHAPFSERVDDELLHRMCSGRMIWVSTLDMHGWGKPTVEHRTAVDNVRRFVRDGGRVLYGTDLGNGPLPVGVNERELLALADAGLDADALMKTIVAEPLPLRAPDGRATFALGPRLTWVPGRAPATADDTARWLASARGATIDTLAETIQEMPA
jgi:hypothetical protein